MTHAVTPHSFQSNSSSLALITNGKHHEMTSTATKVAGIFTVILAVLAGGLILGPLGLIGAPLLAIVVLSNMSSPTTTTTHRHITHSIPQPVSNSWWHWPTTSIHHTPVVHNAGGPLPPSTTSYTTPLAPTLPRTSVPLAPMAPASTPAGSHFAKGAHITPTLRPELERPPVGTSFATATPSGAHFGRGHIG